MNMPGLLKNYIQGWRCLAEVIALVLLWTAIIAPAQVAPTNQGGQPSHIVTTIEGRQIPWVMESVYPWIGGNYDQIERMNAKLRQIDDSDPNHQGAAAISAALDGCEALARSKDAVLVHMDDLTDFAKHDHSPDKIQIFTQLVVMHGTGSLDEYRNKPPEKFWGDISGVLVEPSYPKESQIDALVAENPEKTNGFPTEQAIFSIVTPAGDKIRRVIHIVHLGANGTHVFMLTVPEDKFETRYEEFLKMLKTVQYNFEKPKP